MFPHWPDFSNAWYRGRWPDRNGNDQAADVGERLDLRLVHEVADRFIADPVIRGGELRITVQNRVAILEGSIDSAAAREAAVRQAWATPGIQDVLNCLQARESTDS